MNPRLFAITYKEIIHIWRDKRALVVMLFIPVVELFLLGYAATTDIRHLNTAVYDADRTAQSRALIAAYRASDYFDINHFAANEADLGRWLDSGAVRAAMLIPSGYGDKLARGETAQVAFLLDGSDPSIATTAFAASQSIGQAQNTKIIEQTLGVDITQLGGIEVRPRVWYNPELKSSNYMIPALIGLILQFLTIMFTAQAIVREREQGTLAEILVIGTLWFGVPIRGSIPLLLGASFLFLLTTLGLGLLISTLAQSQQEAMLLTLIINLPGIFLSGFFFPLEAMPPFLQFLSYFIPLRYMLLILRSIVLKGVGIEPIFPAIAALAVFALFILGAAALRFRKRLE
ncbi:MAG: ABC transporter permease [Chloroflexi bacterium]|nr:MAG: ABC transporter permease [Chloroflexota bacterium]